MKFIDKFNEVLRDQLVIHEQLLSLSKEKKDVLISGTLSKLEDIVKEEHRLIQEVSHLEQDRYAMITQLAESLGLGVESITISFLLEVIKNDATKDRLVKLRDDLDDTVSELAEINELNAKLLEQSLEYIQTTMELITDDPEEELFYSNPNKQAAKKGKSVFDAKS